MVFSEGIWTLGLRIRKVVENFQCCLMGHTSKFKEHSGAEFVFYCVGDYIKRYQRTRILICGLEIIVVIFGEECGCCLPLSE